MLHGELLKTLKKKIICHSFTSDNRSYRSSNCTGNTEFGRLHLQQHPLLLKIHFQYQVNFLYF